MKYTADFETITDEYDCRVWAWAMCEIGAPDNIEIGTDLDLFFMYLQTLDGIAHIWFHNLKFDGEFIICWLLKNGFTWVESRRDYTDKTFTTVISDMGQFYSIEVVFKKHGKRTKKVKFMDSYKLLPFGVEKIAKDFGLPCSKLSIDYEEYRAPGHVLTEQEIDYIRNDVVITSMALNEMFKLGLTKMTIGANAMSFFKKQFGEKRFRSVFPILDYDNAVRKSYRGGWTYVNPKYQGCDLGAGVVFDVNSLYPSRMRFCPMPYGEGKRFEGKYEEDRIYPLYVQKLLCSFELKSNRLPMIQLKSGLFGNANVYSESSDGFFVELTLTSVDLKLFVEQYDVTVAEWQGGYKWMQSGKIFNEYVDYWMGVKIKAEEEENKCMRAIAKLMLNNLYGKFATNPVRAAKKPVMDEKGAIHYVKLPEEITEPIYIPIGTFITAYARDLTIRSAQAVYDRFAYADTDSLHLVGTDTPAGIDVHKTKLGAWKRENVFSRARFLRPKCYIEEVEGKLCTTCAGMQKKARDTATWENFHPGATFEGGIKPHHVPGGIVLKPYLHQLRI